MKQFLRENWAYIVVPVVIVLLGVLALLIFGGDGSSPFTYNF